MTADFGFSPVPRGADDMTDWYQHRSDPAQAGHPRHPAGSFAPRAGGRRGRRG